MDIGHELYKNRVSLFYNSKSDLILKIYSFDGKHHSAKAPVNMEGFFDRDHVILCVWNPVRGSIKINVDGKEYAKTVHPFFLQDIATRLLIGTDISKKHFARMLCYLVQAYARPFDDEEALELIKELREQFKLDLT